MSQQDCLSEVATTNNRQKPPESEVFKHTTTTSSESPLEAMRSHSPTLGQEPLVHSFISSRPPPTAMVAPLVGSTSSSNRLRPSSSSACSSLSNSPSRSPKMSHHGLERKGFNMQTALSTPSLDRAHEKAYLREGGSPSLRIDVTSEKIRSLMNILSEKSQLIERQKQTISRLQQECRDKESQLRKQNFHVQQHKGITSSTSAESTSAISAPVKIDMLSRKLDSLHYELDKNTEELKTAREKLQDTENYSSELEKQLKESQSRTKELEQKIDRLQGYLGNMPTMDEHYGLKEEVARHCDQRDRLKEQVREGEETLSGLRETLKKKEEELCERLLESAEASQKNHELELRVHSQEKRILELHSENLQIKTEMLKLQETVDQSELTLRKELNSMRERHKLRFRDATSKLREQHKEVIKRNRLLEKQLLKSSDAMTALNSELKLEQGQISELKGSISELVVQNQGLLQQNMTLQEVQAEAMRSTQSSPADTGGLSQKLLQEISLCVDDFESLVSLVSSMVEGREPNASVLLGIRSTAESSGLQGSSSDDVEMRLQKQLDQILKLRSEVERLRTQVTERFADQIANECTVQ